jgi:undecaprenyl diphosphate synthase
VLDFVEIDVYVESFQKRFRMHEQDKEVQERLIQRGNLPRHIAIIMDGNGRWAKQQGKKRIVGHRAGVDSVRDVVRAAGELGIEVLTLYVFSSENWKRPLQEVSALMNLLNETLEKETKELVEKNVRVRAIGKIEQLPRSCQRALQKTIELTSRNSGLILNLALNYGSRGEIVEAVRRIASEVENGEYRADEIGEKTISAHLFTADLPDPDLLIRTSAEMRLSNFLLWQMAYTEIWVTDIYSLARFQKRTPLPGHRRLPVSGKKIRQGKGVKCHCLT